MFVNWLSNNVPKLNMILCSAGLMVPWLLPERAVAHDVTEDVSNETDCDQDTIAEAVKTVVDEASFACFYMYDGDSLDHHVRVFRCLPSKKYKGKNDATCFFDHEHGQYASIPGNGSGGGES